MKRSQTDVLNDLLNYESFPIVVERNAISSVSKARQPNSVAEIDGLLSEAQLDFEFEKAKILIDNQFAALQLRCDEN